MHELLVVFFDVLTAESLTVVKSETLDATNASCGLRMTRRHVTTYFGSLRNLEVRSGKSEYTVQRVRFAKEQCVGSGRTHIITLQRGEEDTHYKNRYQCMLGFVSSSNMIGRMGHETIEHKMNENAQKFETEIKEWA